MSEKYKTIVIDGVTYNLMRADETSGPKFKVGDWVKVVANKSGRLAAHGYVGDTVKVTYVYKFGEYKENGKPAQAYGVGKVLVVFEDELEATEEPDPKPDPFDIRPGDNYYFISYSGVVSSYHWGSDSTDTKLKEVANACKDKAAMEQRALHEILSRLLWQAAKLSGEEDKPWDGAKAHYGLAYHKDNDTFGITALYTDHGFEPYFATFDAAQSAVDNIVRPFMKAHPEFEW